jgi:hypothetical protein
LNICINLAIHDCTSTEIKILKETFKKLISSNRIDLDARDKEGNTALHKGLLLSLFITLTNY